MLKKTITYKDFNDQERTETFYFNLTKAEVIEMEVEEDGGYGEMLKRIAEAKDGRLIMKEFKTFILKSYGIKTPDGGFEKSEEITKKFINSAAYSEIFTELCTDANAAAEFVKHVIPLNDEQRKEFDKNMNGKLPSNT